MELLKQIHLHPMLVHFPIALFISALVFEILHHIFKKEFFHQVAFTVYVLAVCLTPLAVLTGLREEDALHLKHPVLEIHERFALITLWVSLGSLPVFWFLRKFSVNIFKIVFLIVLCLLVATVSITAFNGGRMVYEYGVGVNQ